MAWRDVEIAIAQGCAASLGDAILVALPDAVGHLLASYLRRELPAYLLGVSNLLLPLQGLGDGV